jgi:N-acetylglucosamine-6-phosphate deacetylase
MSLKIEHAHLVLPYQVLQDAWLISREGKITAYGCGVSPQQTFSTVIDAKGQYLTPGFVDLHVHGGAGADFRDGEEAAFVRAMQAHLAGGTTTMLATVSSTTLEGTLESLRIYEAMRQREAQLPPLPRLAGVHLEGPYFSQKERGAQDETIIRLPDAAEYERILEQAPCLRRWSIACELPGALELGERLHKRGIMASVGHSDATTAQVYEAFGRGFHSVTHLYSGCSVLHRNGPHREGGVVEAAFLIDEMDVEVIADGVHLPPDFLRLIYKIKGPEHIALITDSIRAGAADVPEGTVVYDDIAPVTLDGTTDLYNEWWFIRFAERLTTMEKIHAAAKGDAAFADEPAFLKAAQYVATFSENGYFQDGAAGSVFPAAQALFTQGKAGLLFCGAWIPTEMASQTPPEMEMKMFALPELPDSVSPWHEEIWSNAAGITVDGKNKENAINFLKIFSSMGVQEGLTALKNPSPLVGGPATQELDQIENIVNNATSISGNYGDLQQYGDWFVNVLGPLSTQLINGAITPEAFITQLDTDTAAFYQ